MAAERNHLISYEAWIAWRMTFLTIIKQHLTEFPINDQLSVIAVDYLNPLIEEEFAFDQLEGRYQIPDITCDPPVGETKTTTRTDENGNIITTEVKNGKIQSQTTEYKTPVSDGVNTVKRKVESFNSDGSSSVTSYNTDGSTMTYDYNSSGKKTGYTKTYQSGYYEVGNVNDKGQYIQSRYYDDNGKELILTPGTNDYKTYKEYTSAEYNANQLKKENKAKEQREFESWQKSESGKALIKALEIKNIDTSTQVAQSILPQTKQTNSTLGPVK